MSSKKKNVSIVVSKPNSIVEVTSGSPNNQKPARRRRRRQRGRGGQGKMLTSMPIRSGLTSKYLTSLADPFDCAGPRLGWGNMQPSNVVTAYLRGGGSTNADGSIVFAAMPDVTKVLYQNNAGAGVATWTTTAASDANAISSNYGDGRIISIGIRAFPSVAATAAPGICYVGALPPQSDASLKALTPNDFSASPFAHVSRGYEGGSSTGRPVDASSFIFYPQVVTGWPTATSQPFSVPFVALTNLPATTPCFYEVALNIEVLYNQAHLASPLNANQPSEPSLADEWPSLERMWSSIRDILPSPGQARESAASVWRLANQSGLLRTGANFARNRYGRGATPGPSSSFTNPLMDLADSFLS